MAQEPEGRFSGSADPCASERDAMRSLCDVAHAARQAHESAHSAASEVRRSLAAARASLEAAQAAVDNRHRLEEKERLRGAYKGALAVATTEAGRSEAAATWAREVDRVNRAARRARGILASASAQVTTLGSAARQAGAEERTARIRAEAAEAACLDSRVRLAACEESGGASSRPDVATLQGPDATAPSAGEAVGVSGGDRGQASPATPGARIGQGERLVIEAILWGDRSALATAAAEIAEQTGGQPAAVLLGLKELTDALVSAAASRGFISVDRRHSFWSRLSEDEARDVMRAFGDMGFSVGPDGGWQNGRIPSASDLTLAIAYAGIDPRTVRNTPSTEERRALPGSVRVDAVALLAAEVPDLALDHLVRLLGERADRLSELWDAWGQIRPVLLGPRVSPG